MTPKEVLDSLAYDGKGKHNYVCEAVDQALSDLSEIVMAKKAYAFCPKSPYDKDTPFYDKYFQCYDENSAKFGYNLALIDIAKLLKGEVAKATREKEERDER